MFAIDFQRSTLEEFEDPKTNLKKKKEKKEKTFYLRLLDRTAQGHKLIENRETKSAQSLVFSLVLLRLYDPVLAQVVLF